MPGTKLYTRNTWADEVLAGVELYNVLTSGGSPLLSNVQIALATGVSTPGSPLSAEWMNNIEAGVSALDDLLQNYIAPVHTTAGTATAFTVDSLKNLPLTTGELFTVRWHTAAGTAPTLSRDGLTAKALKYFNSAGVKVPCTQAQVVVNAVSRVYYDGTDYIVLDTPPAPAILTMTSSPTPAVNVNACTFVYITALAENITSMTANLTGTPLGGQRLTVRIKDNGTPRTIAWGASFEPCGAALPTSTVASKRLTVELVYDHTTSKWGCTSSIQEA